MASAKPPEPDPSEADVAVMRKWGWTCVEGAWFMPLSWGDPACRVTVENPDGSVSETREGFTPAEAWTLHRNFHGFFGKEFLDRIRARKRP